MKETAKLPISEDFFPDCPERGVGNQDQSSTPPPPRASAPGYASLPAPRPSAEGRLSRETDPLFYTFGPKATPSPTPPPCSPFCKYVKKKKMQTSESWLEVLLPAVTFNHVIMYRESCWCSTTVWLCNFCTFAIRNIKDLFSYFKPDSPPFSCVSGDFPGVTLELRALPRGGSAGFTLAVVVDGETPRARGARAYRVNATSSRWGLSA